MIFILEGPDGVGKSTLANEIAKQTKGHILHCSWKKEWDMQDYFKDIFQAALSVSKYQDIVIDRWAPSDWVYGNVFRDGPTSDTFKLIKEADATAQVKWIMCKNDNAVLNHLKNKELRQEKFEDMTDVVSNFMLFENDTPELNWIDYNFNKVNMQEFVEGLIK